MKKTLKIKPRIIEETINTKSIKTDPDKDTFRGTWGTPIQSDAGLHSQTKSSGNATVEVGVDNEKQMVSGSPMSNVSPATPRTAEARMAEPFADYADFDDCVTKNSDKDDPDAYCASIKQQTEARRREQDDTKPPEFVDHQGPVNPTTGPTDDTSMPKPEDEKEGPPKTKPETHSDMEQPAGAPPTFPPIEKPETELGEEPPKADDKVVTGTTPSVEQAEEPCPEGSHKDAEGNCIPDEPMEQTEECPEGYHKDAEGNCVPDTPTEYLPSLEERRAKIRAELQAKTSEDKALTWEQKHNELYRQLTEFAGRYNNLKEMYDKIAAKNYNLEQKTFELRRKYEEQCAKATDTEQRFGKLNRTYEEIHRKYNNALKVNLDLSTKLTESHEEYLELARNKEQVEDQFKKARINAKKTLKLRV